MWSWRRPLSYRVRTVHFLVTLPPAICDFLFLRDSLLSVSLYLYIFYYLVALELMASLQLILHRAAQVKLSIC